MPKEHRVQIRMDEDEWQRAEQVAKLRGFASVSGLCRYLLQNEYVAFGLVQGAPKKRRKTRA